VVRYTKQDTSYWWFHELIQRNQAKKAVLLLGLPYTGRFWVQLNKWDPKHIHQFKGTLSGEIYQSDLVDHRRKEIRKKPETHYEIISPIAYHRPDTATTKDMLLSLFKI